MNRYDFINKIHEGAALFGSYRYCNDVAYVFRHVFGSYFDNMYYMEDENSIESICCKLERLSGQYGLVIACMNETDWNEIKGVHSERLVWVEGLFELLDEVNVGWFDKESPSDEYHRIPDNKKIALWGLNDACKFFLKYQQNIIPNCIIDRDLSKCGTYCDIRVMSPDSIDNWKDYYVIIMCRDKYRVRDWLISKGMKETEDFLFYGYYIDRLSASEMMRKTIYAPSKRKIDCEYPFSCARLEGNGTMSLCACEHIAAGNILQQESEMVWNSIAAVIIRLSMNNQTYSFCDAYGCQRFDLEKLSILRKNPDEDAYNREASKMPEIIWMNSSSTCNLYCEMCRRKRIHNSHTQDQRSMEIAKKAITLIKKGNSVLVAGNGEVFLDASYQYLLDRMEEMHHEGLKWTILTNGNLMTKEKVDHILKYGGDNIRIMVSVDAARKETYLKIRRGGNWDKLIENLRYVGQKKKEGNIAIFRLDFVVQGNNVREMGEFVQLAESIGASEIWFSAVRNFGAYGNEEFKQIDIRNENGNIKAEYRAYFENPILKSPIVNMGALLTGKDAYLDV